MIIDLLVIAMVLFFIYKGFDLGFVPTLLGLIGYVAGGLLGLIAAREFTSDWSGLWSIIGAHLLLILIGAKLGQSLAKGLGNGIRGIIGPLKLVDSLLGAVLGGAKAIVMASVVLVFLSAIPNESLQEQLGESQSNEFVESHLPGLFKDAFSKIREGSTN